MGGREYTLIASFVVDDRRWWEVRPLDSTIGEKIAESELQRLYVSGELRGGTESDAVSSFDRSGQQQPQRRPLLSDQTVAVQQRIHFRLGVIHGVDRLTAPGCKVVRAIENGKPLSETVLERVLRQLGHDEGIKIYGKPKKVTRSSYYRWRKLLLQRSDQDDLKGGYSSRGRKNQLGRGISALILRVIAFEIEAARHKDREPGKPRLTFKSVAQSVLKALDAERLKRPSEELRFPAESTLRKYWKEVPAYTRAIAMWGPTTARSMFRRPPSDHEEPLAPLSLCQFDETRLPLFVVDEIFLIPIGRPWLAWIVDVFTGGIIGFYLGFEPPSDLVISSTLRHACLFKTYMRTEYPDITAEYLMAGVPRFLTFDNSKQAHGASIAVICGNLDILRDYQAPRMPWLKAYVEGTFEVANRTVLSEMPGFVLSSDLVDRNDYNPQDNACIGFRQLLWLIHRWIVEVYHVLPPATGCKIPPNVRWQQGIKIIEPGYIARSEDLDVLFGIVREGRLLDQRGVSYA
jgi:hypothetical protein